MCYRSTRIVRTLTLTVGSMALAVLTAAQAGPCTEDAIKQNKITVADDVFMYMTPFGKPVIGKSAAKDTSGKKFADHTNVKRSWVGEHRIVSTASGDMAYEAGTLEMSYDTKDDGQHHKFQAVMLEVYKAKDGACQLVAETMEPLPDESKPSAAQTAPGAPSPADSMGILRSSRR